MTDREWVEMIADLYYAKITAAAYHIASVHGVPNADIWAADSAQTVFLTLNAELKKKDLRHHENIAAWLNKTLYHIVGDIWQKKSNSEVAIGDIELLREAPICQMVLEDPFPPGLTDEDRDLLYRCHCLGIPRKEIARSLGISVGACQMRVERAEERFRRLYAQQKGKEELEIRHADIV